MLAALARAVERRHPWIEGHAERVASLAIAVARSLGWDERAVASVATGSLLHDIGKLSLAPELLGKPGPLSRAEEAEVRTHPLEGARLVGSFGDAQAAVPCVLYHHERWDGCGYPTKLCGDAIPLEARLVAIADAFDAMTSLRPHRPPLSVDAAVAEIARCSGTQFDPILAAAALGIWGSECVEQRVAV